MNEVLAKLTELESRVAGIKDWKQKYEEDKRQWDAEKEELRKGADGVLKLRESLRQLLALDTASDPLGLWVINGTLGIHEALRVTLQSNNIDGGGEVIATGIKGHLRVPFSCIIDRVTLAADQVGSIQVDIWKRAPTPASRPLMPTALPAVMSRRLPPATSLKMPALPAGLPRSARGMSWPLMWTVLPALPG